MEATLTLPAQLAEPPLEVMPAAEKAAASRLLNVSQCF